MMDGSLNRIYFPISPVCHLVSKQSRKNIMTDVNRESHQSKVSDLLSYVPMLIDEMNHNEDLSK